MTVEQANRWADALESGKYQQTQGKLNRTKGTPQREVGLCCMGVACEEFGPEIGLDRTILENGNVAYGAVAELEENFLPREMALHLGLTSDQQYRLADLNDGDEEWHGGMKGSESRVPQSFSQIAPVVRSLGV